MKLTTKSYTRINTKHKAVNYFFMESSLKRKEREMKLNFKLTSNPILLHLDPKKSKLMHANF